MELAHATACILRRGVVRLAALVGRMFVNDQEKALVDIGKEDALAGQVKLRFGNVEARLEIKEDNDEVGIADISLDLIWKANPLF